MTASHIARQVGLVVARAAAEFPAVVLTGPRQSGKTTLVRHMFGGSHGYMSLELPDIRAAAEADPRGFLALHTPPVMMDEVQYAPELLPYIKERIDAHRSEVGQYLLTGSQNLMLMERVSESPPYSRSGRVRGINMKKVLLETPRSLSHKQSAEAT